MKHQSCEKIEPALVHIEKVGWKHQQGGQQNFKINSSICKHIFKYILSSFKYPIEKKMQCFKIQIQIFKHSIVT